MRPAQCGSICCHGAAAAGRGAAPRAQQRGACDIQRHQVGLGAGRRRRLGSGRCRLGSGRWPRPDRLGPAAARRARRSESALSLTRPGRRAAVGSRLAQRWRRSCTARADTANLNRPQLLSAETFRAPSRVITDSENLLRAPSLSHRLWGWDPYPAAAREFRVIQPEKRDRSGTHLILSERKNRNRGLRGWRVQRAAAPSGVLAASGPPASRPALPSTGKLPACRGRAGARKLEVTDAPASRPRWGAPPQRFAAGARLARARHSPAARSEAALRRPPKRLYLRTFRWPRPAQKAALVGAGGALRGSRGVARQSRGAPRRLGQQGGQPALRLAATSSCSGSLLLRLGLGSAMQPTRPAPHRLVAHEYSGRASRLSYDASERVSRCGELIPRISPVDAVTPQPMPLPESSLMGPG